MPRSPVVVDLRSDTVTRPSPEMRRAIAEAEVGDAVLGDDPTVAELESFAAELLGKERALFFPSGIMANQTALMVLAPAATEVVIDAEGHILNWEDGGAAVWGGVQLRAVPTATGHLSADDVRGAIRRASPYLPRTSLVCLENTHNSAGGSVLPVEGMREVAEVARERGIALHLDGARLPNAAVAAGRPMRAWAELADTVMVSLSKGLGGPVGSILAGTAEAMERGWRVRRRLGGGMRQAGLLAAAGLFGLRHNMERLAEDHARARRLAEEAATIPGLGATRPETNIAMIRLEDPRLEAEAVLEGLERRGVRMTLFGPRRLRAVTHLDVGDEGIGTAVEALRQVVGNTGT